MKKELLRQKQALLSDVNFAQSKMGVNVRTDLIVGGT